MPDYSKSQKRNRESTMLGNNKKMKKKDSGKNWRPREKKMKRKRGNKGRGN